MVFQFEHVGLDHGGDKWHPAPLDLLDLKALARALAGGSGRRRLEQPVLEQPRPAAGRVPLRRRRRAPRRGRRQMLATVLHLHRGTPYVYQGEELGHDQRPVRRRSTTSATSRRCNHYAEAVAAGQAPADVLAGDAADEPRQRPHADAVGRARAHAGFTTGAPWIGVNPNSRRDQRRRRGRRPGLGVPPLPAADRAAPRRRRWSCDGDFTMLLADDPHVYAFTRALGDDDAARPGQLHRRGPAGAPARGVGGRRARARQPRRRRPRLDRSGRGRHACSRRSDAVGPAAGHGAVDQQEHDGADDRADHA